MRRLRPVGVAEQAVVLVGVGVLALLTFDVAAGGLVTGLDESVRNSLGPTPEESAAAGILQVFGELGVSVGVLVIVALVSAQLTWSAWPVLLAGANVVVVTMVVLVLKAAVGRLGPGLTANPDGYWGYFPSGHTATSTVCFGTAAFIVLRLRGVARQTPYALVVGLAAGALAGAGAVLGDFHWTSDVLGALAVSTVVMTLGFGWCRSYVGAASTYPRR